MLTVFFDAKGVVHHEYLPEGSTVNQTYYVEVLKCLKDAIHLKRPEMWRSGDWFFHHDNTPAHSALRTVVLPHSPDSSDLAPCDFFLFPKLKRSLKGRRYEIMPEINANATKKLKDITKKVYQDCFNKWKHCWYKCMHWRGEYLEGDSDLYLLNKVHFAL